MIKEDYTMYLNKYDIKGETYVKLDELNDLIKAKHREIVQKMKKLHAEGKSNTEWTATPPTLTELRRNINMSEDGEKYLIFTRDKDGNWEFLVDCLPWKDVPSYIRKCVKQPTDWVTVGTNEYEEATLYDTFEDAEKALRDIVEKSGSEEWHMTKKWMFDTKENRESLLMLFYDGGEEKPKEKRKKRCPGRYTVWYRNDEDTTQHCMGFVGFSKNHMPMFTNRPCMAKRFVWRGEAEAVAQICGEGFEVVDMIDQMTKEERLLRAIFHEDGMDGEDVCEYHGDGTKAEDEDWDGKEESK